MVGRKTSELVNKELTFIAMKVWEKYAALRQASPKAKWNYQDCMNKAKEFYDQEKLNFYEEGKIRFLNLSEVSGEYLKSAEEQQEAFQNFFEFWVITVFLVIEEHF